MKLDNVRLAIALGLLSSLANLASATVLRVDKTAPYSQGSYPNIQQAINFSTPGDTISIEDGQYNGFHLYTYPGTWESRQTVISIEQGPLTFIGDSREGVRIGPTQYTDQVQGELTQCIASLQDIGLLRFENLTLENTYLLAPIYTSTVMKNCRYRTDGGGGLALFAPQTAEFEDCVFEDIPNGAGIWVTYSPTLHSEIVSLRGCEFTRNGFGVQFAGVDSFKISQCVFVDNVSAVHLDAGTAGGVEDCRFERNFYMLTALDGAHVFIKRSRAVNNFIEGLYADRGHLAGTAAYIEGGNSSAISVWGSGTISLQNSTILKGTGLAVSIGSRKDQYPVAPRFDLTNNYWGTTDLDSIRAGILDGADYPHLVEVDFEPILTESPVATVRKSMSELKALFGPKED